jgi:predicted HNH restriction endonuclease
MRHRSNARAYRRRLHYESREAICNRDRARRHAWKRRAIESLGGACVRCRLTLEDVDGHVCAFDFHHTDPGTKSFTIARNLRRRASVLDAELLKCILLCATCHRIVEMINESSRRRGGRPTFEAVAQRPSVNDGLPGDRMEDERYGQLRFPWCYR